MREVVLMVIFDKEDMKWAMEVFNIGRVVYPNIDKEEDKEEDNKNNSGDDSVETENK